MTVACVRCSHRATSVLTYDHAGAEAYLDDARGNERSYEGLMLCETHAGGFSPPIGWQLLDRRRRDLCAGGEPLRPGADPGISGGPHAEKPPAPGHPRAR